MNIKDLLEKHGFDKDTSIKQVQIVNGARKYVIEVDGKKYRLSDSEKEEIVEAKTIKKKPVKKTTKKKK